MTGSIAPLLMLPLLALDVACLPARGTLAGDTYRNGPVAFRIGRLPAEWQRVQVGDGHLAFHHRHGGAIMANASCDRRLDLSLELLTGQLLYGIEARRQTARSRLALDGRMALRTQMSGTLDGVPIALDLVVLKKDGCTYDLALAASPRDFGRRQADFEHFFRAFAQAGRAP